jgi:hypothetical protein
LIAANQENARELVNRANGFADRGYLLSAMARISTLNHQLSTLSYHRFWSISNAGRRQFSEMD